MNNKFKEIEYDKIKYIAPSWEEMGNLTFLLAKMILKSGKKYDRVVALARGGWTWARTLVDYLQIDNIASVHIKFYRGVGKTNEKPVILQSLSTSINKEKILLLDDVADSGKTLQLAREYLLKCGAKNVDTATLFYKPRSVYKPEYYSYTTTAWVIFPHEVREIIELSGRAWLKNGLKKSDVLARFKKLGLPKGQVKYFVNKIK